MSNINIERTLGRIEGQLALVLEEQKKASIERKGIDQHIELIERKQDAIERRQETAEKDRAAMAERLKTVEKNTAEFNKWKERGVGALMLISGITALIGGALAASWQRIIEIFR